LDKHLRSLELAEAPHKLYTSYSESVGDDEVLFEASNKMMEALVTGKGVTYSRPVLKEWLSSIASSDFRAGSSVANWAIETLGQQATDLDTNAVPMINSILLD